ncbi:MAG: hypothetical protein E6G39_17350, partial [Actinobacteria bacterium]
MTIGYRAGKQVYATATVYGTEKDADQRIAELHAANGLPSRLQGPSDLTVGELLERWVDHGEAVRGRKERSPNYIGMLRSAIRRFEPIADTVASRLTQRAAQDCFDTH